MAFLRAAEYIQELNMHSGLYSAVVQSLQHYDRLHSSSEATTSYSSPNSTKVMRRQASFLRHGCFFFDSPIAFQL